MAGHQGAIRTVQSTGETAGYGDSTTTEEGPDHYSEKPRGYNFRLNATFDAIDEKTHDALKIVPGGRAPNISA
jgi:hypothetical protein